MPMQGLAALAVSGVWTLIVLAVFLTAVRYEKKNESIKRDDE